MSPSVGVVVLTLSGMQHIDRCLESVGWADTVDLCALDDDRPDRAGSTRSSTDWVFYLFGEEEVDAELSAAILDVLRSRSQHSQESFGVRVRSRLLDRWVEASCWGPTPSERLLRTHTERPFVGWRPGPFGRSSTPVLPGWISDRSFEQVANGVDHVNALSTVWARNVTDVPHRARDLMFPPVRVFSWLLWQRNLWLRGLPGFGIAVIAAYTSVATVMKSWERNRGLAHRPPLEP